MTCGGSLEAAQALEAFEAGEGAVELALDGGFVAHEGVDPGLVGQGGVFVEGPVVFSGPFDGAGDMLDLGAEGAAEPPVGDGNFLDEEVFEGADGMEVVDETGKEVLEILAGFVDVFALDDDTPGQEAVFEGVEFGAGLALGGAGAGGVLGVAPVGIDLSRGSHRSPLSVE